MVAVGDHLDGRRNLLNRAFLLRITYLMRILLVRSLTDARISVRFGLGGVKMNFNPLPKAIVSILEIDRSERFLTYPLSLFA